MEDELFNADTHTHVTKLTVTFRKFVNAPKNELNHETLKSGEMVCRPTNRKI